MANALNLKDLVAHAAQIEKVIETVKEVQQTPDKSRELALAVTKFEEGLMWLQKHIGGAK